MKFAVVAMVALLVVGVGVFCRSIPRLLIEERPDAWGQASDDCLEPISQVDMNRCADQNQTREEARLKINLQQMASKLEPAAHQRFEAAQQAWQSFRLKQCSFEVASYEGGSMAPMVYATCMADLAQQRNKDLLTILNEPR